MDVSLTFLARLLASPSRSPSIRIMSTQPSWSLPNLETLKASSPDAPSTMTPTGNLGSKVNSLGGVGRIGWGEVAEGGVMRNRAEQGWLETKDWEIRDVWERERMTGGKGLAERRICWLSSGQVGVKARCMCDYRVSNDVDEQMQTRRRLRDKRSTKWAMRASVDSGIDSGGRKSISMQRKPLLDIIEDQSD